MKLLAFGLACSVFAFAEPLERSHSLPAEHTETMDDSYMEGYVQALLNSHYYEFEVRVSVRGGTVYLYHLPDNRLISNSIIAFVKDIAGVKQVYEAEGDPPKPEEVMETKEVERISGVWFPQSTLLFQPLIADPREPLYSVEYRWGDKVLGQQTCAVSYGDTFPIYRWTNVGRYGMAVQFNLTAGAWSVFKMWVKNHPGESSQLQNTSYLVGIPISIAFDNWSMRFRVYHQSCHLGDEFMNWNPNVARLNPSIEAIDWFTSYQVSKAIRFYFGPGVVVNSDQSFHIDPLYFELGTEMRAFGRRSFYHQLYGTGFIAINVRLWQEMNFRPDLTTLLGYELSKLQGIGRKFRFFGGYHNGYSEGQFFKEISQYGMLGLSYGF